MAIIYLFQQTILKEIEDLRHIGFEVEGDPHFSTVRKSQNAAEDYKKLGFEVLNSILVVLHVFYLIQSTTITTVLNLIML